MSLDGCVCWSSRAQRKQGESCSQKEIKTAAAHVGIESRRRGVCQADQVERGCRRGTGGLCKGPEA